MSDDNPKPLFVSDVGMTYTAQNQYQGKVLELVRFYDRQLISRPDEFVQDLTSELDGLYKLYPRCKKVAIDPNYNSRHDTGDRTVVIWGNKDSKLVSITLKNIRGTFDGEFGHLFPAWNKKVITSN